MMHALDIAISLLLPLLTGATTAITSPARALLKDEQPPEEFVPAAAAARAPARGTAPTTADLLTPGSRAYATNADRIGFSPPLSEPRRDGIVPGAVTGRDPAE